VEVARPQVKTCHRNVPLSVVGVTTTAKKPSTTSFKMAGQTWVVGSKNGAPVVSRKSYESAASSLPSPVTLASLVGR